MRRRRRADYPHHQRAVYRWRFQRQWQAQSKQLALYIISENIDKSLGSTAEAIRGPAGWRAKAASTHVNGVISATMVRCAARR